MARIALIVGFAAAGALTGGLAWAGFLGFGIAGSALGAIGLGAAVGGTVGQLAAAVLFPGHSFSSGPRLQDTQISSSAPGMPIPILYGSSRMGGQIIWATGIHETKTTSTVSAKGAPSQTSTTYSYTTSFAAMFCEGPANVLQVWGDAKLIYDKTGKGAIAADKLATGIGTNTKLVVPKIYPGSTTQLPDPTIQADRGINFTPGYRGRCYIVYENFPLADFGNRLPNIRGLCVSSTVQAYIKDTYPPAGLLDPQTNTYQPSKWPFISPLAREAVVFDIASGFVVETIDLNTSNTIALGSWIAATVFTPGMQILDPNGNVQSVYSTTGDQKTGGSVPTFTHTEGDTTTDNHVTWINVGAGPSGIPVTAKGILVFPEAANETFSANTGTMPFTAAVDSQGYIWNCALVSKAGISNNWYMYRFDPRTFAPVARIDLGPNSGPVLSYVTTAVNGRNVVIATTARNYTDNGQIYFIDGASGGIIAQGLCAGTVPNIHYANGPGTPAIDKQGVAYVAWWESTSSPWAYAIYKYDARSGGVQTSFYFFNGDATHGVPRSVVWNAADNSLICFNDLGAIVKIDVKTMTILATSAPLMFDGGGNWFEKIGKAYNGQAPASGLIVLPAGSAVGVAGNTHYLTFDCTAFAEVSRVNQRLYVANSGNWSGVDFFAYDVPTHSIVASCINYFAGTFRIYLERQTVGGATLDQVVLDLLKRGNLDPSLVDATQLSSDIVFGYPMTRNTDVKNALTPLAAAYFFDIVERDFKLYCVKKGGSSAMSIPEADLGLLGDGFEVKPTFAQEADLPKSVEIMYSDPARDYQPQKQGKRRHARVVKTKNKTIIELPLTLNSDVAMSIAVKALQVFWDERNTYTFNLYSAKYQILDPSDVVTFTYRGKQYAARITKTVSGLDFSIQMEAASEDPRNYITAQKGSGAGSYVSPILNPAPNTILFVLDIGLLQDQDASVQGSTGFYDAMSTPTLGWPGGALYLSTDNENYLPVDYSNTPIPYGIVGAALPAPARPYTTFDYKTVINVRMAAGQTLSSCTMAQLLNGANACLIGTTQYIFDPRYNLFQTHPVYPYELLQFKNATLLADGSYNLDTLIRGQRGTEWTVGMHLAGETFILLGAGGMDRKSAATSIIGINYQYYKGVTVGADVPSTPTLGIQHRGMDLRPYAPCQVRGVRDGSNNLTITWVRRTRVGGDGLLDGIDTVPLAEDNELYEIDVFFAGLLIRPGNSAPFLPAFFSTTPSFVYTAAQQTSDGLTPGTPIHFKIYQVSAQVGPGIPADVTL
jgi:hypothetical protein